MAYNGQWYDYIVMYIVQPFMTLIFYI